MLSAPPTPDRRSRGATKPEYQNLRLVCLSVGQLAEIVLQTPEVTSERGRQFAKLLIVVCVEKCRRNWLDGQPLLLCFDPDHSAADPPRA
jgi:hypothetical protein